MDKLGRPVSVGIGVHAAMKQPRVFLLLSVCAPGTTNCLPALKEARKRPLTFDMLARNEVASEPLVHALCVVKTWEVSGRVTACPV